MKPSLIFLANAIKNEALPWNSQICDIIILVFPSVFRGFPVSVNSFIQEVGFISKM